jgi:rhodanese-related sulfurtransferase
VQAFAQTSPDVVDAAAAADLIRKGAVLLDVRTAREFEAGHIAEALNIPLQTLSAGPVQGLPGDHATPVVTICGVGKRSLNAMLLLKAQGYEKVKSVRGGMQAWMSEGHPLSLR